MKLLNIIVVHFVFLYQISDILKTDKSNIKFMESNQKTLFKNNDLSVIFIYRV